MSPRPVILQNLLFLLQMVRRTLGAHGREELIDVVGAMLGRDRVGELDLVIARRIE
jgi:hypothetical protein